MLENNRQKITPPVGNTLVVYALLDWPLRSTLHDHLYAFRQSSASRVFYLNVLVQRIPRWLLNLDFDLIVYHNSFFSTRWSPEIFQEVSESVNELTCMSATSVALVQDEFLMGNVVADFINQAEIDVVFTTAAATEIEKLYPRVDRQRTHFHRVLTGYLATGTLDRIARIVEDTPERTNDIGYRAYRSDFWLGSHGVIKWQIAEAVAEIARREGLVVDISTSPEDTLLGDTWFEFLASCEYTIGVEGGASIADLDGEVKAATEAYLARNPSASFDEVKMACFRDRDGELSHFALSPRHLEACATRTAQVLVEGEYNGVLTPWVHYFPVKKDLSDLERVLALAQDKSLRDAVVERAYVDIVESGAYVYSAFVAEFEEVALGQPMCGRLPSRRADALLLANQLLEGYAWFRVAVRSWLYRRSAVLPAGIVVYLLRASSWLRRARLGFLR